MRQKLITLWHQKVIKDSRDVTRMPAVRWGNILYLLLHCYLHKKYLMGSREQVENWLQLFPELQKFYLKEEELKPWDYAHGLKDYHQILNQDFTYGELKAFVEDFFLSSKIIQQHKAASKEGILYVNVRRGDYYTPEHAPIYGFNIPKFMEVALNHENFQGIQEIRVISDDIGWCKNHLNKDNPSGAKMVFLEGLSPEESFLRLATAKNLVISNSTFCYWAAYITTFLYQEEAQIVGPAFGNRHPGYYEPKQYLPEWHQIKDFNYEMPFD